MEKLLVLELDGSFEQGVKAKLEIRQEIHSHPQTIVRGQLPPNQELLETYRQWQRRYSSLENFFRALTHSDPDQVTNSSNKEDAIAACQKTASLVEDNMNCWLNYSKEFEPIREALPSKSEQFRLWIQTDNVWLQRLPWEKWNRLQNAEVAIVVSEYDISVRKHRLNDKIKVLAILGYATDLKNLPKDKQLLDEIAGKAGAEIVWEQGHSPQELNQLLRQGNWDILFFSGHSASTEDGKRCEIQLTQSHKLELSDFRFALRVAAEKGLRLAIFNSCDGIGLAHQLAAEKGIVLPHLVFMREKLPDPVSPKFLQHFLEAFTLGKSLYTSVQEAQKILHDDWEKEYPCASWLPVVCPNPTEETPTWDSLSKDIRIKQSRRILRTALTICLAVAAMVVGVRELGGLELLELAAYDRMMQMRPKESIDDPIDKSLSVITIDEEDRKEAQQQWNRKKTNYQGQKFEVSLADEALLKLLKILNSPQYRPRLIGLDLLRDFDANQKLKMELNKPDNNNIIGICRGGDSTETLNKLGVSPPAELPPERIGFSDVVLDRDNVLRRFLWAAEFPPDSLCLSNLAFSIVLAGNYLESEGVQIHQKALESEGCLKTDKTNICLKAWDEPKKEKLHSILQILLSASGPYKIDRKQLERGYQVWLNYRNINGIPSLRYKLSQLLEEEEPAKSLKPDMVKVKDKIVLIGATTSDPHAPQQECISLTQQEQHDTFLTPLNKNNQCMYGVFIQAHMVSQLLRHLYLGDSQLLFPLWNLWQESVWILGWTIVGGLLSWRFHKVKDFILAEGTAIFVLSGTCYLLFLQGWWVPYVPPMLVLVGTGGVVFIYRMLMPSGKFFPKAGFYTQRR